MKAKKCPSCGAPVSGLTCTYCGLSFTEEQKKQTEPEPSRGKAPAEAGGGRAKRTLADMILIFLGGMWVLIVISASASPEYWSSAVSIAAVFVTAAPGIILLMIGFRKKKAPAKKTGEGG